MITVNKILFIVSVLFLLACNAPKYTIGTINQDRILVKAPASCKPYNGWAAVDSMCKHLNISTPPRNSWDAFLVDSTISVEIIFRNYIDKKLQKQGIVKPESFSNNRSQYRWILSGDSTFKCTGDTTNHIPYVVYTFTGAYNTATGNPRFTQRAVQVIFAQLDFNFCRMWLSCPIADSAKMKKLGNYFIKHLQSNPKSLPFTDSLYNSKPMIAK